MLADTCANIYIKQNKYKWFVKQIEHAKNQQ